MKKKVLVGIIIVVSIITLYAYKSNDTAPITNYPPKNETIVAFGDSLVQGIGATEENDFVSLLTEKLQRPIINLGVSGDTTQDGLRRIHTVIEEDPGMVLVLFGGNDFLKRISKETTESNLREIVAKLQENGSVVVLLGVRGGILKDDYASMYEKIADDYHALYVNDVLRGLIGNRDYMSDTVHPNDKGYQIISERIYKEIRSLILTQ